MSPGLTRTGGPCLMVLAGLVVAACDSAPPGRQAPGPSDSIAAATEVVKPKGLPDTLEAMLRKQTLAAFAAGEKSGNDTTRFTLPGGGACNGQDLTILAIATKDSKALRHGKDFGSSNGYIVARLVNPGACATRVIPIDPGREVWWVARMHPMTKAFDSRVVNDSTDLLGPLGFNKCPVEHDSPKDLAEVRSPAAVCATMGGKGNSSVVRIESLEEMSLWVACSEGCCYTDRAGSENTAAPARGRQSRP